MTHRPPKRLLVFMSGHICLSFHVVGAYSSMCRPYTDRLSADHTVLSSHVALTYDDLQYCWSTAAESGTPAEDMAAKAGWICSAGSSGSASSLRSIRCVRALSRCFMDNSRTDQLANRPTRRHTNSPTVQLANNKLAYRPTRRQLNWPKKPTRRN